MLSIEPVTSPWPHKWSPAAVFFQWFQNVLKSAVSHLLCCPLLGVWLSLCCNSRPHPTYIVVFSGHFKEVLALSELERAGILWSPHSGEWMCRLSYLLFQLLTVLGHPREVALLGSLMGAVRPWHPPCLVSIWKADVIFVPISAMANIRKCYL